ncbi:MAG: imidazole glycerol phosphate synthase subunit HisH [Thermoplasmatota archaeon]
MIWTLFDYGVGNLHSLQKALQRAGAETQITDDPNVLADADVAVLPGVGAFGHVMERLAPAAEALRQRHRDGRPMLGICIGMQALYESSDEADVPGLGILPGRVTRLPASAGKVPHMGWNTLDDATGLAAQATGHVYYVHSYAAAPDAHSTATTNYGQPFSAALEAGNTVAFQFHPEKSGPVGAAILAATVKQLEAACN